MNYMKKQVFNPFLPLNEYIPDGEPHVFGDRVYLFGSHDKEGGHTFCMLDYTAYSASVTNLTDWRCEGVIFKAAQDPDYAEKPYMYAPDVVRGNDGRYYLYYCMSGEYGVGGYCGTIHVAVCDTPAGQYEFLGEVRYPDGRAMHDYVCFDPAAMNDDGTIRLYYGTQYDFEEREDFDDNPEYLKNECGMFGRSEAEILEYMHRPESCPDNCPGARDSIMGAVMLTLEDDMLTVQTAPHHIIPYAVKGSSFEKHPFFEAASMRKINGRYYFIYSSMQNHELCYAVSDLPDRGFSFGGTIVSNGDIGFDGRSESDKHNMTGTTHGSIERINGEYYVFYHRLTHKSDYSRQACAEKIFVNDDGSIDQVELTSCGLNGKPLKAEPGCAYPAVIACIITNGHMPHGCNSIYTESFPNVNNTGDERFISEISDGTLIGYKYFDFKNVRGIRLTLRAESERNRVVYNGPVRADIRATITEAAEVKSADETARFELYLEENGKCIAAMEADENDCWHALQLSAEIPNGVHAVFLRYCGNIHFQLKEIEFI